MFYTLVSVVFNNSNVMWATLLFLCFISNVISIAWLKTCDRIHYKDCINNKNITNIILITKILQKTILIMKIGMPYWHHFNVLLSSK